MTKNLKFCIGRGDDMDYTIHNWIVETFPAEAYTMWDDGYFERCVYVNFNKEKDAALFLLKWKR